MELARSGKPSLSVTEVNNRKFVDVQELSQVAKQSAVLRS